MTMHGEIQPDILYTFDRVKQLLNWGPASLRRARKEGMPVSYKGRCGYIKGSDLILHITSTGSSSRNYDPPRS
jgi:hypothetical protein